MTVRRDHVVRRTRAAFAVAFVVLAIVAGAAFTALRAYAASARLMAHTHETRAALQELREALYDAQRGERGYAITGDPRFLEPYERGRAAVALDTVRLRLLIADDPGGPAQAALLGRLVSQEIGFIDAIVDARRARGLDAAVELVRTNRGKATMDSIVRVLADVDRTERRRLRAHSAATARRGRAAQVALVAGFGCVFGLAVVAGWALLAELGRRRSSERAALRAARTNELIIEAAGDGLLGVDGAGRITFLNPAAARMLHIGDDPLSLVGRPADRVVRAVRVAGEQPSLAGGSALLRPLVDGRRRTGSAEVAGPAAYGGGHDIQFVSTAVRDESGDTVGAVVVLRDVTAERAAADALRAARDAALEASKAKSDFLARMSHELRTPLNSVIGFANLLRRNRKGTLSPTDLVHAERIAANGTHLLSLINDILDLSKVEAGHAEPEFEDVDLARLVADVVAALEAQPRAPGVVLAVAIPDGEVAPVRADERMMRQVLTNLVANALKFTHAGRVTARLVVRGGHPVRVDVVDSGIGIARDRRAAVFEAFEQAEAGTTRQYGGTGLGLPIARSLCALMGFGLELESEPGRGSLFSVLLDPAAAVPTLDEAEAEAGGAHPPAPAPARAAVEERDASPATLAGRRVLVVDDEPDERAHIAEQLARAGATDVRTAAGGRDALDQLASFAADLVVLDLMMPAVDGFEVLRTMRASRRHAATPVIVVSARDLSRAERALLGDDVVAVLRKGEPAEHALAELLALAVPPRPTPDA